ncbi:hypothetical protein HerbRD11066_32050 [Herbidospora sp. RD11066]
MPRGRRYPSDLTDAQWVLIELLLPVPKTGGRPEKHARRDVVDAILYVVRTGCSWRQLPVDFPPWQTVYWYFVRWEAAKVTEQILAVLRKRLRAGQGRQAEPSAGIIESQSVKGADTVGCDSRGYDANKKINGRKRFIVTDTLGLLLVVCVMAASVQDRNGAKTTLLSLYLLTPVRFVYADAGFAGRWWTGRAGSCAPPCTSPQGTCSDRVRGDPSPLGGRTLTGLANRLPPPGPRLRTPPRHFRGHDPLGRHRRHRTTDHPRHRQTPAETHTRSVNLTFSNTH